MQRKKKPATRQPKIRWSVLGLAGPTDGPIPIDIIRQQVSSMARHGIESDLHQNAAAEPAIRRRKRPAQ